MRRSDCRTGRRRSTRRWCWALRAPRREEVIGGLPVQYRYGDIFSGEKRSELLVVPALSVRVSPEVAIMPTPPRRAGTRARRNPYGQADRARWRGARHRLAAAEGLRASADSRAAPATAAASSARDVRVTVVNDTRGRGGKRRQARRSRTDGRRSRPSSR